MNKKKITMLFLLLVSTVSLFSMDMTIIWTIVDYPPFFIHEGDLESNGVFDQAIKSIQEDLSDFEHHLLKANMERSLWGARNEENYCITGLFKTEEREEYLYYSKPFFYTINNGIIVRESEIESFRPYLNIDGEIVLSRLLEDGKMKIGVQEGFKYSRVIDTLLADSSSLIERPANDGLINLLKMISLGRIDGTIGYDYVLNYLLMNNKITGNYRYYNFYESREELYIPVHFAVPKNEWGDHLIRKINSIIENKDILNKTCIYFAERYLSADIQSSYLNDLVE